MRLALRLTGILVTIASFIFVFTSIYTSFGQVADDVLSFNFMCVVGALTLLYAAALQLVGLAWYRMIVAVEPDSISKPAALSIFNRSQVYKYIPGNVFHMVGRYALAKAAGVTHGALALSQIGEIAVISVAALLVAALLSTSTLHAHLGKTSIIFFLCATITALIVAVAASSRFRSALNKKSNVLAAVHVFILYVLFFLLNGVMVVALLATSHDYSGSIAPIIGIASAAWLLGFVIPGAPGGLGAREAILIAGMTAIGLPVSIAAAVAIGHRLSTIGGDALVAVIDSVVRWRSDPRR
ncbi:lysylphosphatidylglycerol synthase domain-containing protein [Phyllobacterium endophyticum]|uniref:lysylphosphatidylglycerol synthase domain-containing protein n=1 Tax=Phyllobacterium endophyticum TaxID=1149773 RepID=UPI0011C7DE9E|nr:lysylphosphatidylglycerol synthase domain-containing protein [Phyllobacterium endophyticum]TXR48960.1 hypothetical protein FVA77_11730 [Phyllobacterium endophyticum]